MAEIVTLPKWKKGASAYERLSELALLAKEQPEKFDKFVIVYQELLSNGNVKPRTMSFALGGEGLGHLESMGLLESGKIVTWNKSCA